MTVQGDHTPTVAIVTGASRGLGAAVAVLLARLGAAVTITARSEAALMSVAREIREDGGQVLPLAADVASPEDCRRVVSETLARWKGLNALVNNAGTFEPVSPVGLSSVRAWHAALGVNLLGPYMLARYALDGLRRRHGRIINVSSGAAERVIPGASAYCAAKAGLNHFTRVLAAEEPDIVAVAVRPGMVDTGMQALIRRQGPPAMPDDTVAFYKDAHRAGKLLPPDTPAMAIAWLARFAPAAWSGTFLDHDDPRIALPAARVFARRTAR